MDKKWRHSIRKMSMKTLRQGDKDMEVQMKTFRQGSSYEVTFKIQMKTLKHGDSEEGTQTRSYT